jgi:hypothetical protein
MTTKITRTNNSDINELTGSHRESLVRCMESYIRQAYEAIQKGDYSDAATCVRIAYTFEQQVLITQD